MQEKIPYGKMVIENKCSTPCHGNHKHLHFLLTALSLTGMCLTLVRAVLATPPLVPTTSASLGLPALETPTNNPLSAEKVVLGKKLFFDKRLSANRKISCASCHQPQRAFSDGLALAIGIGGKVGTRNTPTLLNAAFNTSQFWEGRRASLEAQAGDPFVHATEHGLKSPTALLRLVRNDAVYVRAFSGAFAIGAPKNIDIEHITQAISSFERTLIAGNSPFDRYTFNGDTDSLSVSAQRGLILFKGAAQCASCHTISSEHALFTDNAFHRLNIGLERIQEKLPALTMRLAEAKAAGKSTDRIVLDERDIAELGRFIVTLNADDISKFRTPSLRNVALTAPYMHDGSVATLEEAVEIEVHYRSGESGRQLILTPQEKADLVAFLKTLTSPVAEQLMKNTKSNSDRSSFQQTTKQ